MMGWHPNLKTVFEWRLNTRKEELTQNQRRRQRNVQSSQNIREANWAAVTVLWPSQVKHWQAIRSEGGKLSIMPKKLTLFS